MSKKWAGYCNTYVPQCRYQLMLIQVCFHELLTVLIFLSKEKKTQCWWWTWCAIRRLLDGHFSPHMQAVSSESLSKHTFFLSMKSSEERISRANIYCRFSTGNLYEGVGMGLGGCEGKRLRYEMTQRWPPDLNYESNFQVARGRSAYDPKRTRSNSSKTRYEYSKTWRSINHRSE